ncbi:MAG: hypothetical protein SOZ59_09975 [Candidatus Limivivens sp.]|nr:hypothetical protein [Candidatus Limivivens sp.]
MRKTTYFRFMYQNRKQGIAHTAHVTKVDGNENYLMVYLCGMDGVTGDHSEEGSDERFAMCGETIDLMVLDGIGKEACGWVCQMLENNFVKEIILAAGDKAGQWLKEGMAGKVTTMRDGETIRYEKAGWETWIGCFGDDEGRSLAVFHGPMAVDPKETDCVLSVKPFGRELPCGSCMRDEDHVCAMRCNLYNDFDLCKRHNERGSAKYVAGTLLLGNVKLQKYGRQLLKELSCNENAAGKIRFITLAAGGNPAYWSSDVLTVADPEAEQYNRYFIVPESAECAAPWKEIMASSMRHKMLMTTEEYGICAGGFFTDRE